MNSTRGHFCIECVLGFRLSDSNGECVSCGDGCGVCEGEPPYNCTV